MQQPIISVSGLRGIVGTSLTPASAIGYVAACVRHLPDGPVILSRDGRSSGSMLASAVQAALIALGRDVLYANVAATPTTGVLVRQFQAAGAFQISASHNPAEYNGIKVFSSDGRVVSAATGQRILASLGQEPGWATWSALGSCNSIDDTTDAHLNLILETVDVPRIRARQFSVVLDSNHGAGSRLGLRLLQALDAQVTVLGGEPDGQFEHPPEPTEKNLEPVARRAAAARPDVVFCQDPDADRLALIGPDGSWIGEEYTLALTLARRLDQEKGDCVINCATSRMSIDIARQHGCTCHLSAVGEANVCDRMVEVGAVYGGEGNGGPIDPRVGYVRDSFVGMAQILDLMAATGQPLAELVARLPRYAIVKETATIDTARLPAIYSALKAAFPDAVSSDLDGLRLDWDDRWLLVRPSNTEPIVRIICETDNRETAANLAAEAKRIVSEV
jgi:phosphomannomutase